jgi:hypothetical protein
MITVKLRKKEVDLIMRALSSYDVAGYVETKKTVKCSDVTIARNIAEKIEPYDFYGYL